MSTTRPTLAATDRTVSGKAVAQLRKTGLLPAVVFGHGLDSQSVTVDAHEFEKLRRRLGANALVDLSIDGAKAKPVLVQGVQNHVITGKPLHADLFLVRMTEEMTADVPLLSAGDSEVVRLQGGVLLHPIEHVRVRALPDQLPQSLVYDISSLLTFDDAIYVRDLPIPAGVTLLTDGDEIVVKVAHPRVEEAAIPAAGEAAQVAEAAAAAEAASASGSDSAN